MNTMIKEMKTVYLVFLFLFALFACGDGSQQTQKKEINLSDYVGTYELIEDETFKFLDFYEKQDTLFLNPSDDEIAGLYYERNDVFGCPMYNVKIKFFRNDQNMVDSLAIFAGMEKFHARKQ